MPPHPTFGTSAGSRNADCGPGFRQDTFSQVGAGYRGERLIEPSSSPDVGKGTFSQVVTLGVCVRAIPFLDAISQRRELSLGVVRPSADDILLRRSAGGAKLPSVGLCLNASEAEARLDMATLLLGLLFVWGRIGFGLHPGLGTLGLCLKCARLS